MSDSYAKFQGFKYKFADFIKFKVTLLDVTSQLCYLDNKETE